MKYPRMTGCKITAAVVTCGFTQIVLLQQSPNIDFHIGGLCDM